MHDGSNGRESNMICRSSVPKLRLGGFFATSDGKNGLSKANFSLIERMNRLVKNQNGALSSFVWATSFSAS